MPRCLSHSPCGEKKKEGREEERAKRHWRPEVVAFEKKKEEGRHSSARSITPFSSLSCGRKKERKKKRRRGVTPLAFEQVSVHLHREMKERSWKGVLRVGERFAKWEGIIREPCGSREGGKRERKTG